MCEHAYAYKLYNIMFLQYLLVLDVRPDVPNSLNLEQVGRHLHNELDSGLIMDHETTIATPTRLTLNDAHHVRSCIVHGIHLKARSANSHCCQDFSGWRGGLHYYNVWCVVRLL